MNNSQNIIWLLILLLILNSCSAQKTASSYGILKGTLGIFEGNCMPGPGVPPCEPNPFPTTLFITSPSEKFDWDLLVDSVVARKDGAYEIKLKEGTYSLFLRDGDEIVCTIMECPSDCFCSPITITRQEEIVKDLQLDHATW